MVGVLASDDLGTDRMRLDDLVQQHGLSYRKAGAAYQFDDRVEPEAFEDGCIYTARGLREALALAEGFDRAKSQGIRPSGGPVDGFCAETGVM
jgi:hypothetical protein